MGQGPQPGGPGEEGRCALLGALAVRSEQTGGGPSGWLPARYHARMRRQRVTSGHQGRNASVRGHGGAGGVLALPEPGQGTSGGSQKPQSPEGRAAVTP